MHVNGLAI